MQIDEAGETDALHGEVQTNRIKRHYFEPYSYLMSLTVHLMWSCQIMGVARRARVCSWVATMLFAKAVFSVQYDGMDADEIERARRVQGARCELWNANWREGRQA